jgi:hypothetical protein
VPAQESLRGDEQRASALSWKDAARGGEQGTVRRAQARAFDAAAQHFELVSEHEQLDVFEVL